MKYINELLEKLKKRNVGVKGSNDGQMKKLYELSPQKVLPEAYVEFMQVLGNGVRGDYMCGESCFMNEIDFLRESAIRLLAENDSEEVLSENDFVFWMCQGCSFCFFKLSEGANPPVYFYNEGRTERFIRIADSLTEFLINKLEGSKDCFREKEN